MAVKIIVRQAGMSFSMKIKKDILYAPAENSKKIGNAIKLSAT